MSKNHDYTSAVNAGAFPDDPKVPLDDYYADQRGIIQNVILSPITSVARIRSVRGSVRANHYHLTDWHYALVESGRVLYFEREIGATDIPEPKRYGPGEMFFTPPMKEHTMLFTEDSVIYTFARNVRSHESHESDLVRVEFITPEIAAEYLK